jgi:hypothetical protein
MTLKFVTKTWRFVSTGRPKNNQKSPFHRIFWHQSASTIKKNGIKKRIGDQKTTDSNHCQARHIIT